MSRPPFAAVILAAGQGTRMKSNLPKVLHKIAGLPMINHVRASLAGLAPAAEVVVIAPNMERVAQSVKPARSAVQQTANGTGAAVLAARQALEDFSGDLLVVFGDTPFLSGDTLAAMLDARRADSDPAAVVLGFEPDDPARYGRLVVDEDNNLQAIVEWAVASPEERQIGLCNAGAMVIDGRVVFDYLDEIAAAAAKPEIYLTDVVEVARRHGRNCAFVIGAEEEAMGINSRNELAEAEALMQNRLRAGHMAAGVTLVDPLTVWFTHDTEIGKDVVVDPHVVFGPKVKVGEGVHILAFSHLEGAEVAADARVGPYARLRPGAQIAAEARIGNFVEVKNATIAAGAKVNHLTYIGDAAIGAGANIGAGTITCNYDGFGKYRTEIGAGAFIGSNTALVAPVVIGEGAIVGAGSTITEDVAANALGIERAEQSVRGGWAQRFREKMQARMRDKK